jgi:hypothetical protein
MAVNLLGEALGTDVNNAAQKAQHSLAPHTLLDVFNKGRAALGAGGSSSSSSSSSTTTTSSATGSTASSGAEAKKAESDSAASSGKK